MSKSNSEAIIFIDKNGSAMDKFQKKDNTCITTTNNNNNYYYY